jgi:hypothetical protein
MRLEKIVPGSQFDKIAQRLNIRKDEIRTRNGGVESDLAAVDPGNGQSKRFTADEIGELRLPGVQDLILRTTRIFDQIAKQRSIGLVALGSLCRAYQVEVSLQWRQRKKVVVNIRNHRQFVSTRQPIKRADDIIIEDEVWKGIKVAIDSRLSPVVSKCAKVSASESSQMSRYDRYGSQ